MGPANISATNMNLLNYSVRTPNVASGIVAVSSNTCVPNDGLLQTFQFNGILFSVPNNPYEVKYSSLILFEDQNIYRKMNITIANMTFINMENSFNPFFVGIGNIYSELYITYSSFKDSSTIETILGAILFQKVVLSNLSFSNFTNVKTSILGFLNLFAIIGTNISISNLNMDKAVETSIFQMSNFNFTFTLFTNLSFNNVSLMKTTIFKSNQPLSQLIISNSYFNRIYQSESNSMFTTGNVGSIVFQNHTFVNITSTSTDVKS